MKCKCGENMRYAGGYKKEVPTPNGIDYYFVEIYECDNCCEIIENEDFIEAIDNEDL